MNFFLLLLVLFGAIQSINANDKGASQVMEKEIHLVVAMPFDPGRSFDPHWYTPEYVDYIANLLPKERYDVSGYFVSFQNIPQFIDEIHDLYSKGKNVCVFNVCDGGEWDGYPGISLLKQWEKHPIKNMVPMTGADAEFIINSDNKAEMNLCMRNAKLNSIPQALVLVDQMDDLDLATLLEKSELNQLWPLFCKLNVGAGALGIGPNSVCWGVEELEAQVNKMHKSFPKSDLLLQPYLPGPEYTVLVVQDQAYVASVRSFQNPLNIMLDDYLFGLRPLAEELQYAPVPAEIQEIAVKAVQAIPGKHHYTRVDMREDGKGNVYIIDINDRPGFGTHSSLKTILEHYGMSESRLLQDILSTYNR